jgi:cytochrome d ubiquinol oxidase subunit II
VSEVVAAGLLLGVIAYALFGGADFGGGFWDLTAGGAVRGKEPRALVEHSLGPVWEANHTWLIYCLVVFWTGFPRPFAAIASTLYLPLGLSVLGIVMRGSGFAFRKVVTSTSQKRLNGAAFAASSVVTPFFLGTAGGGIASGRVPSDGHGDPVTSWLNPTSLLAGALAVAVCAYLAAVYLTAEARRTHDAALESYFQRRAWASAWVAGALSLAALLVAHADAHRLFHRLLGPALPPAAVSMVAGLAALVLLRRGSPRLVRTLAGLAVAALVVGWGTAQYPFLLGTHASLDATAAPEPSLVAVTVVFVIAGLLVVPSLVLLYVLAQRGHLEG